MKSKQRLAAIGLAIELHRGRTRKGQYVPPQVMENFLESIAVIAESPDRVIRQNSIQIEKDLSITLPKENTSNEQ